MEPVLSESTGGQCGGSIEFFASACRQYALDVRNFHFHGDRSLEQFHGEDQPTQTLLAYQDSFHAFERPRFHPHAVTSVQKRVRFNAHPSCNSLADSVDLISGNGGRPSTLPHKVIHAGGCKNRPAALVPIQHKNVIGKQREREQFHTVFPAMHRFVEGQEDFRAFPLKQLRNGLLVLMTRVKCKPLGLLFEWHSAVSARYSSAL